MLELSEVLLILITSVTVGLGATCEKFKRVVSNGVCRISIRVRGRRTNVGRSQLHGFAEVKPLMAAIEDVRFPGRGYAAWALSQVLVATDSRNGEAMELLLNTAKDRDPYCTR